MTGSEKAPDEKTPDWKTGGVKVVPADQLDLNTAARACGGGTTSNTSPKRARAISSSFLPTCLAPNLFGRLAYSLEFAPLLGFAEL